MRGRDEFPSSNLIADKLQTKATCDWRKAYSYGSDYGGLDLKSDDFDESAPILRVYRPRDLPPQCLWLDFSSKVSRNAIPTLTTSFGKLRLQTTSLQLAPRRVFAVHAQDGN